jgi:tetratricopeptide (TPR) repeat protein
MSHRPKVSMNRRQRAALSVIDYRRWVAPAGLSLVLLAMFVAYWPAKHGEIVWDDDVNLMNRAVCSHGGLYRIWFEPGSTQQYYPVFYSALWLEHQMWGNAVLGYHLINVVFHSLSVLLVYRILTKLNAPGALLAAAIFAVHPVMVESVAWMTEQRNTLSAVFYLSSMLVYLEFDESRGRSSYFLALGLFAVALLSKTATVTLPVALLVILWWERGRLSWKLDIFPLLPFFAVAAAAGVMTAWVEWTFVGASGADYELTLAQRFLVAGHAIWFYLAKLIWPANLIFVYPRWIIDPSQWWQWVYPVAAVVMTGVLWSVRKRWRAPLACWLFYCATLFPALGFLNMSYFAYSFVADHLQYLASLGLIAFVAGGFAHGAARLSQPARWVGLALSVSVLATLVTLSGLQSRMFASREILYQTTIDRNPACWMAHTNLAADYLELGNLPKAIEHLQLSLGVNPKNIAAWSNYGVALTRAGRLTEAVDALNRALALNPDYPQALNNLGLAYAQMNRNPEAIECFQRVLRSHPEFAEARNGLGSSLYSDGRIPEAIEQFRLAVQDDPSNLGAQTNLGRLLYTNGDLRLAIPHLEAALQLEPRFVDLRNALGESYRTTGRLQDAIEQYEATLRMKPDFAPAYAGLAQALATAGRSEEAAAAADKGIAVARSSGQDTMAEQLEEWVKQYRAELRRAIDVALPNSSLQVPATTQ